MIAKVSFVVKLFPHRCRFNTLSGVNHHVLVNTSFLSKTFSTLRACVRLLASVDTNVLFQGSFVSETFSTMLADERPVSCVNCHMALRILF